MDIQGKGLNGELVRLRGQDALGQSCTWDTGPTEEGRFEFRNLPGGRFTIEWVRRKETRVNLEEPPSPDTRTFLARGYVRCPVSLTEASDLVQVCQVEPNGSSEVILQPRGRASLHGSLVFPGALPEAVPVALELLDDAGQRTSRRRGALAEFGRFVVPGLEPGHYQLGAEFPIDTKTTASGRASIDVPEVGHVDVQIELIAGSH